MDKFDDGDQFVDRCRSDAGLRLGFCEMRRLDI
jgi:hypothetical protein